LRNSRMIISPYSFNTRNSVVNGTRPLGSREGSGISDLEHRLLSATFPLVQSVDDHRRISIIHRALLPTNSVELVQVVLLELSRHLVLRIDFIGGHDRKHFISTRARYLPIFSLSTPTYFFQRIGHSLSICTDSGETLVSGRRHS